MTEPRKERCETCRWWLRHRGTKAGKKYISNKGDCRRYPPTVMQDENEDSQFPISPLFDWCGEWQPIGDKPPRSSSAPCSPATK